MDKFVNENLLPKMKKIYPNSTIKKEVVGEIVGFNRESIVFDDEQFHRNELSLIASRNALSDDFTDLIKLMEDGIIDTSHWISDRANWNSLVKTLPIWCDSTDLIKGVVEIT